MPALEKNHYLNEQIILNRINLPNNNNWGGQRHGGIKNNLCLWGMCSEQVISANPNSTRE